jgi:hypothetical protein
MKKYDPYKEHPYAEHWTGSVKDLVRKVAYSDARYSAIDTKSGATIFLDPNNLSIILIESPNGENMYDAYSQRQASKILAGLRRNPKVAMDKGGHLL